MTALAIIGLDAAHVLDRLAAHAVCLRAADTDRVLLAVGGRVDVRGGVDAAAACAGALARLDIGRDHVERVAAVRDGREIARVEDPAWQGLLLDLPAHPSVKALRSTVQVLVGDVGLLDVGEELADAVQHIAAAGVDCDVTPCCDSDYPDVLERLARLPASKGRLLAVHPARATDVHEALCGAGAVISDVAVTARLTMPAGTPTLICSGGCGRELGDQALAALDCGHIRGVRSREAQRRRRLRPHRDLLDQLDELLDALRAG